MAKPTLSEISKLFKTDDKPTDFHYYGTVVSADTDNRTYEVSINRDKNITVEAARLVGAHVGDTVMVTVMANGYATVTGRVGGDTDASDAQRKADGASDIADKARAKAVSALSKATEADQLANQAKRLADQAERNASRSADAAFNSEQSAQESAESAARSATAADTAERNAASSKTAAETAQQNAADSQTAAEAARDRAAVAEGYADTAQKQAAKAEKEASAANSYAVGALNSLSTTQDIIGVLSWVEESIKYVWDYPPTVEDKEYDPSKQYYTVIGKRVIDPIETDYDKYYVLNSESEPASKSGNIVTFDSDLDNFPLKSLTATINPKQDLHGYDKPWAGGAGKNLMRFREINKTLNGVTFVSTGEKISITGTATANTSPYPGSESTVWETALCGPYPAGQYTVEAKGFTPSQSADRIVFNGVYEDGGKIEQFPNGVRISDGAVTFTASAPFKCGIWLYITNGSTINAPSVEVILNKGSAIESWTPYSNICPISGWESVNATVEGLNRFPFLNSRSNTFSGVTFTCDGKGTLTMTGTATKNDYMSLVFPQPITIPNGANYKFCLLNSEAHTGSVFRFVNGSTIVDSWAPNPVNREMNYAGMSGKTVTGVRLYCENGKTYNLTMKPMFVPKSTVATEYIPYTGTTYHTNLPETVYGGSLDVVNGVLTVDRAMVDLGTLNWGYNSSYEFFYSKINTLKENGNLLCSAYNFVGPKSNEAMANVVNGSIATSITKYAKIKNTAYTNTTSFKTAMNGVQLVYKLAEPRTIQLTPKQVTTLLGTNNVWADSGDVTVEYWDGPVGYITPTSSFDPTETYYTVKGSPVKIDESKQEEHSKGLYYVHDLTNAKEAMADFIKAHLALTGEGLYVLKGPNDWRVLVANDGVYIIDPQGRRVASYGEDIAFDSQRPHTIGNENQYVKYYQDEEDEEYKIAINADSITLGSSTIPTTEETIRQASDAQKQAEANAKAYADDALESFTSRFTVSPEEISSEVSGFQDGAAIVSRINQLPDSVKIEAKNVEIIDKYESYIELAAAEAAPYILLGKRDNNAMLLRITNKRMGFEVNSEEVAYLAPDALHVQKQISFGDFIMKQRENGHLSIIRVTRGG